VFVEGRYRAAFYAVEPTLSSPLLFVRDLGDARNLVLACRYPDRASYVDRGRVLRPMPRVDCP
jgi:hypothetical protein